MKNLIVHQILKYDSVSRSNVIFRNTHNPKFVKRIQMPREDGHYFFVIFDLVEIQSKLTATKKVSISSLIPRLVIKPSASANNNKSNKANLLGRSEIKIRNKIIFN